MSDDPVFDEVLRQCSELEAIKAKFISVVGLDLDLVVDKFLALGMTEDWICTEVRARARKAVKRYAGT